MVLLLLRDFRRTQEAEGWVAHTYRVINSAESLLSMMKDAEIGERGFMLTGDERYLAPYNSAIAALPNRPERAEGSDLRQPPPAVASGSRSIGLLTRGLACSSVALSCAELRESTRRLPLVRSGQGEQIDG